MKRTFICLLVAFAFGSSTALAATTDITEIGASGTGSVSLPPDVATVNAAVETYSENAADAVAQNNAIYDRAIGALRKLGIARDDVTLGYYNVRYNPRPAVMPATPTGERYGYTVTRSFLVKVHDIGKAGTVSDACIAAGATGINGVDFGLSDPDAARSQAIAKAVADARSSAEALARAAGLRIVRTKSIDFGGPFGGEPVRMMARVAAAPATQFDESNVNVTVTVRAVYVAVP
jgi:uncharacterized protein